MVKMKTVILGAGISGLAAGYKTGYPIYEMANHPGGICHSYMKDGFQFSRGGPHWIFGNERTTKAMEFIESLVELNRYDRLAGIYYNKIFPYPIQTVSQKPIVANTQYFKQWLVDNFGINMCNMFFHPFNEKYTAGLMDEIIQFDSYKSPPAGSVGFVSKFSDPVGGLGTLVNKMAEKCDIRYTKKAVYIDPIEHEIEFEDETVVEYDRLISTIPLDVIMRLCERDDFDLPYSSVFVLNIGAEQGPNLPREHWLYIPFCKCNFYRVGFYTNVNSDKAPPGKVGLSVEIAFPSTINYEDLDIDYITYHVIQELQSWGWIKEVAVTDPTWVKTAYTWNRNPEERERHIEWLEERDIISIGRYATWKFQGMAESIEQGLSIK